MSWLRRLSNTLRPGRHRRDIEREIAFHVGERAAQLEREGMNADEARRRARLQFGNVLVQAERTRDPDITLWLDTLLRNVRHATRALARTPGFTLTLVLTLALGIGANTAVFSAIDAVLLRPLPFPDADRLVRVSEVRRQTETIFATWPRVEDWNRLNSTFEAITAYSLNDATDTSRELPERTRHATVGPRFLDVLGVAPILGRGFDDEAYRFGAPTTLLASDGFWRNRLGADAAPAGRTIRIADVTGTLSLEIAGVMPPAFLFPDREVGAWSALKADAPWQSRQAGFAFMTAIGRLKPGVTVEQARADLTGIQRRLGQQYPETDRDISVAVTPLKDVVVGNVGQSLWLLFGAVSVLLMIACTNIASMLLARGAQRAQEVAVRYSLGASRRAVAGQMLTEAMIVALGGAAAALLMATGTSAALQRLAPDLPRLNEVGVDGRILLYTIAVAVVASLLCGVAPALRSSRNGESLARTASARVAPRHALQWLLVGVQVALSVTLLVGAGLLLRSFERLANIDPGFDPSRVLAFRIYAPWGEPPESVLRRVAATLETVGTSPGIEATATTTGLPGVPVTGGTPAAITLSEGAAKLDPPVSAEFRVVSPSYFETMRIPIDAGELCRRPMTVETRRPAGQVMVNRAFADRYFAGRSVIGLQATAAYGNFYSGRIVGIVANARERAVDDEPSPTVYGCDIGLTPNPWYLARTAGDPEAMVNAIRVKLKEVEPLRAVYEIAPLEQHIGRAYAETRLRTLLLVLFATTALALACLGIYGTLSYVVNLRRREVGLRLALGAARASVMRHFLTQGVRVASLACLAGLLLAVAFTRLLSGMLFGVSPFDPVTVASVLAVVLGVASLAALIPATRAALAQPADVLRGD